MTMVVTFTWALQVFWPGCRFLGGDSVAWRRRGARLARTIFFRHVAKRIDSFLDPGSGEQLSGGKVADAFKSGGVLVDAGTGRRAGQAIPAGFAYRLRFAVAGEEFGVIVCLSVFGLFAFVVLRGMSQVRKENDLFTVLAVSGLLTQFGIQAVINMGVAVNLFPAKGMTLLFFSYGGSSVIAIALGMGMMLALTRRRYGKA